MPDFRDEIRRRLAPLQLPAERELELVEELSQHLEDEYESALPASASEAEARAAVLQRLDASDLLAVEWRRADERPSPASALVQPLGAPARSAADPAGLGRERGGSGRAPGFLADLGQDLRYGLRMLARAPGFTAVALLALVLGIGANSAIFSVVNSVLLRRLPFRQPEALMMVWEDATHLGFPENTPSAANFRDWREQNTVFDGLVAFAFRSFNLTGGAAEPERLDGRRISAGTFALLGVTPLLGRNFLPEEDRPGANVVLLSHGLWQRRFGADPHIVGRAITLDGESRTVVGVMPRLVELPNLEGWTDQLWVPLAFTPEEADNRGNHYLWVLGRLKPGVTRAQAQAEMTTVMARLEKQYPAENTRMGIKVRPLHDQLVGDIRPALLVLLGAVGFVLLIACANVANLLLARAAGRQREMAVRLALGAVRSRLTRQFLTESLLLAALGGAGGLVLAWSGLALLKHLIPAAVAQAEHIALDGRVVLFTAGLSLATGLLFGLFPALQASSGNLSETLKEGGRDGSSGRRGQRLRSLLVVAEVAISFLLLIGAGLLIASFVHLLKLDPGYRTDHLLTLKLTLGPTKYPDREQRVAFFREVTRRVRALPGVVSVAAASNLPLTYYGDSMPIGVEGRADPPPDQMPDVIFRVVSPGYFETMGIRLVQGRDVHDSDTADKPRVAVISEKMAQHFWPGENPLGKRFKPGSVTSDSPWREVVGVVRDVRQNDFLAAPKMQMYFSHEQVVSLASNALVVRTSMDPLSLGTAIRNTVWSIDREQPVSDLRTMEELVASAVARQRFSALLLGVFAGVALILAAVGIYGVMSYTVSQRTREIGLRMALGAQRGDVLRMTVQQGLRLVALGLALGLVAAFALTRVMASLLHGVSATDPLTFGGIALLLLLVAALASYLPALRASRVDPMEALRNS